MSGGRAVRVKRITQIGQLTNRASDKQQSYLKALMLECPTYVHDGKLTKDAATAYASFCLDGTKASGAIRALRAAGYGTTGSKPRGFKSARHERIVCGGVNFSNRWDHEQNCNNPNCRG